MARLTRVDGSQNRSSDDDIDYYGTFLHVLDPLVAAPGKLCDGAAGAAGAGAGGVAVVCGSSQMLVRWEPLRCGKLMHAHTERFLDADADANVAQEMQSNLRDLTQGLFDYGWWLQRALDWTDALTRQCFGSQKVRKGADWPVGPAR